MSGFCSNEKKTQNAKVIDKCQKKEKKEQKFVDVWPKPLQKLNKICTLQPKLAENEAEPICSSKTFH